MKTKIKNILKKYIPNVILKLKKLRFKIKNIPHMVALRKKLIRFSGENKIYLFSTPCHGNLGDHAITLAEEKLLHKGKFFEINDNDYKLCKNILKKYITDKDVLFSHGGGNLGTLWSHHDDDLADLIQTYPNNKIIVFPQTVYYDNTKSGQSRLENNKKIYSSAKDLTICLRDKNSYDFCKENFQTVNLIFTPDIVLSIDDLKYEEKRKDVLLCLRSDKEKSLDESFNQYIESYLETLNIKYSYTDTVLKERLNYKSRNEKLDIKWREFASTKLVITDRLHGMIFAAITGTPCLAIDNLSKKVSGVYEWIKYLDYVKVCFSKEEIIENINEFYNKENCSYNMEPNKIYFDKILKEVKKNGQEKQNY